MSGNQVFLARTNLPMSRHFLAKEIHRGPPMARYSVMNSDPPLAQRLSTPKTPPPAPHRVCVILWTELVVQESSPASEMTDPGGKREFEYRHGGADDVTLLSGLLFWIARCRRALNPISARLNLYRESIV